ncbi:Reverse transcriptase (RNA-dependent DNA polymerase) [Popillia japonica]|uniref:Reverse transcriptase (RNA-dependent DNA polymerase) n=1 Tax=Popillia japonica TaxID=7064 RepID=A0AAW1JIE5_POPJA
MTIQLTSREPIMCRPYRLPYAQRKIVTETINILLDAGIVRESRSNYASPVVLVRKRDGIERMCVDYRRLNAVTKRERVPMMNIDEQLDKLANNKYFTVLDLASGYYQIPIAKECRHLTSFVTTDGQYEFNRLPFGLVNGPSVFSRLMSVISAKLPSNFVSVYMDDLLIPSVSVEDGLNKLKIVLDLLQKEGLTLNLKKCHFLQENVEYLGFEVDAKGVRPGERKTEAVKNFKRPENLREVRQFLGLTGFFRRFIQNYATIASPLTLLTRKETRWKWEDEQEKAFEHLKQSLSERPVLALYNPDAGGNEKSEQEKAFEHLKQSLSERPVLALYNPDADLEVHTDASKDGLAGILVQKDDDEALKPIAFFSRQTSQAENNYHSYELESLAVVEALERFRVYLLGRQFKVVTDCNSLKTIMKKRDLLPRIARWILKLQEYQFSIEHRPGNRMLHADALSRNPNEDARTTEVASIDVLTVRIEDQDWVLTMQLQDKLLANIRAKLHL